MSKTTGYLMLCSGICIFIALTGKIVIQPFIPKEHYIHNYFPATELVLGIPIILGVSFFIGFGIYILKELAKNL